MSSLPQKLPYQLMLTQWAAQLNPVIANPLVNGQQIDNIVLTASTPKTVYHSLGQKASGFIQVNQNAGVLAYTTQPLTDNSIILEASANVTVSIWIY